MSMEFLENFDLSLRLDLLQLRVFLRPVDVYSLCATRPHIHRATDEHRDCQLVFRLVRRLPGSLALGSDAISRKPNLNVPGMCWVVRRAWNWTTDENSRRATTATHSIIATFQGMHASFPHPLVRPTKHCEAKNNFYRRFASPGLLHHLEFFILAIITIGDRDTSSLRLVESIRIQTTAGAYLRGCSSATRDPIISILLFPCEPCGNRAYPG